MPKKKCSCGATFYTEDSRKKCMECIVGKHNKKPGVKQATEKHRTGNPDAPPIEGVERNRGQSVGDRIAEGARISGLAYEDDI